MAELGTQHNAIFGGLRGAGDLLSRNARYLGGKTGLIFGEQRFTWRETNARACRFADALGRLGVKRGECVGICARNSHQWVEAAFALAKLGAVLVTVNCRLAEEEIAYILKDCGACAVLAGAAEQEKVRGAAAACSELRLLVTIDAGAVEDAEDYESLVTGGAESEPQLLQPLHAQEPLMLLYTSGTTGFPKGAIYTHGSTLVGMFVHVHAIGSRGTHRVMLPSPLYSAAGIAGIYCAVYVGSASAVVNFDADTVLDTIARERITFTNLVPTTIQRLLAREDLDRHDLSSLEVLLYGGSPIPLPVLREAASRLPGCGFRQTFASSETGCAGTVLEPQEHRDALENPALEGRLLSCGQAQVGVEVEVTDAEGHPAAAGEVGEIAVRTEAAIAGFWNNPQATREAIRNGWVYTGDMARRDEDGYFYLVDRKKDMIISGALNVYPSEVERVLHRHPAVYEAAVVGVPSAQWGEEVKAVAVVQPGCTLVQQELIDFCEGKLAGFKKPKSVDFVEKLPRNATGKILRRQLREPYWSGHNRGI